MADRSPREVIARPTPRGTITSAIYDAHGVTFGRKAGRLADAILAALAAEGYAVCRQERTSPLPRAVAEPDGILQWVPVGEQDQPKGPQ